MSYKPTRYGERGRRTECFAGEPTGYSRVGQLPGGFPAFPGMLPGPPRRFTGMPTPNMPTSIFPTHTRVGDVVTITGPFGGLAQGQVRIKFNGSRWLSPQMMGPATASVVVPAGARNGLCEVEINGRRTFGTNCIVDAGEIRGKHHRGAIYSRRAIGDDAPALRPQIAPRDTFTPAEPRFTARRVTTAIRVAPTVSERPGSPLVAEPPRPSTRHDNSLRRQIRQNLLRQRVQPSVVVNVQQPAPMVPPVVRAAADPLVLEPPPDELPLGLIAAAAAGALGFALLFGRKKS